MDLSLTVIGVPVTPAISTNPGLPILEDTVLTLTCSATSTSTLPNNLPSDLHPIMEYSWQRDNSDIPTDGRHTVSGTDGNTLTIDKVLRDDNQKPYKCTAQEAGSRESNSKELMVNVYCKYIP